MKNVPKFPLCHEEKKVGFQQIGGGTIYCVVWLMSKEKQEKTVFGINQKQNNRIMSEKQTGSERKLKDYGLQTTLK